jgi:hypothetical protein
MNQQRTDLVLKKAIQIEGMRKNQRFSASAADPMAFRCMFMANHPFVLTEVLYRKRLTIRALCFVYGRRSAAFSAGVITKM